MKKIWIVMLFGVQFLSAQVQDSTKTTTETKKIDEVVEKKSTKKATRKKDRFLVTASAGLSFRLAEVLATGSAVLNDHLKKMMNGTSKEVSVYYMLKRNEGVGFKFNQYSASNHVDRFYHYDEFGNEIRTFLDEKTKIDFYGITYIYNFLIKGGKHILSLDAALGYMSYNDESYMLEKVILKGGNVALYYGVDYNFSLTKDCFLGTKLAYSNSALSKLTKTLENGSSSQISLPSNQKEGLAKLDLQLKLMYKF